MMLASSVDWTSVLDTAILAVPASIGAIYAGRIHRLVVTPSGTSIGRQVEGSHHTAIANNQRLVSISDKLRAPVRSLAAEEEAQVPKLAGNGAPTPGTEE